MEKRLVSKLKPGANKSNRPGSPSWLRKRNEREARSLHLLLIKLHASVRQGICVLHRPFRRDPASSSALLQLLSHLRGLPRATRAPRSAAVQRLRESSPLRFAIHALLRGTEKATRRDLGRKGAVFHAAPACQHAKETADPAVCPGSAAAELRQTHTRVEERAGTKARSPLLASCSARSRGAERTKPSSPSSFTPRYARL